MTLARIYAITLAVCSLLLACSHASAASNTTVFKNVNVIPMDGNRVLRDQSVTVRDDRIVSVEPAATAIAPKDARIIDAAGKYLMPGLSEMHAHLPGPNDPAEYMRTTLALYVANGITSARGMLGHPGQLAIKHDIESGRLWGPSLFLTGPGLSGESVASVEDAIKQVLQQKAEGWDAIKILPGLTRAEYDAIMTTARRVGMRTSGHVPEDVGLERALQAGQETIEHLDGYREALDFTRPVPEERLRAIALQTRDAGVWNTPTMAIYRYVLGFDSLQSKLSNPELEYLPKFQVDQWVSLYERGVGKGVVPPETARIVQQNRERLLQILNDVGAGILLGSDSPNLFQVPGFSTHAELLAMQEAGLSPYHVLLSGTRRVGEYFRKPTGTVTVGSQADLILLDANPLEDVGNVSRQLGVMLRGQWFPQAEIQRRLQAIRAMPGNYRLSADSAASRTVDLRSAEALEELERENPEHFRIIQQIIDGLRDEPKRAESNWLQANFAARNVDLSRYVLRTSHPPKQLLQFTLDDVRYVMYVVRSDLVPAETRQ